MDAAWKEFLRRYSNLFLKIIWQFETDHDEVMDKYLYVCSKLAANDLAIVRRFKQAYGDDPPKFSSWLYAVVRNLCVDAHRAVHGRRRYPRAMARLSDFDRHVFALYYWEGYTVEEIEQIVGAGPPHNEGSGVEALSRIETSLTQPARQRAARSRKPDLVPYEDGDPAAVMQPAPAFPDASQTEQWLATLSDEERLIVRLRFWEDLTGPEIARALGITPPHRVYSALKKALERLRQCAEREPEP